MTESVGSFGSQNAASSNFDFSSLSGLKLPYKTDGLTQAVSGKVLALNDDGENPILTDLALLSEAEIKKAKKEKAFVILSEGNLQAHEKHRKTLDKAREQGTLRLVAKDRQGKVKTYNLSSRNISIISLSESEYHQKITALVNGILKKSGEEHEGVRKRQQGERDRSAIRNLREREIESIETKKETRKEEGVKGETAVAEQKKIERESDRKAIVKEKADKVDTIIRKFVERQEETLDRNEQRRNEELKQSRGDPPYVKPEKESR